MIFKRKLRYLILIVAFLVLAFMTLFNVYAAETDDYAGGGEIINPDGYELPDNVDDPSIYSNIEGQATVYNMIYRHDCGYWHQLKENCYQCDSTAVYSAILDAEGNPLDNIVRLEYVFKDNNGIDQQVHRVVDTYSDDYTLFNDGTFANINNVIGWYPTLEDGSVSDNASKFGFDLVGISYNDTRGIKGTKCHFPRNKNEIKTDISSIKEFLTNNNIELENQLTDDELKAWFEENYLNKINYLLYFPYQMIKELVYLYVWYEETIVNNAGETVVVEKGLAFNSIGAHPEFDSSGKCIGIFDGSGNIINEAKISTTGNVYLIDSNTNEYKPLTLQSSQVISINTVYTNNPFSVFNWKNPFAGLKDIVSSVVSIPGDVLSGLGKIGDLLKFIFKLIGLCIALLIFGLIFKLFRFIFRKVKEIIYG